MRTQQGFTLIEIMVVVVIIGILAAMIAPNILGRADEARITTTQSDLLSISNALDLYRLDNLTYPTTSQGLKALVNKPGCLPEPVHWNPEGYLKKLPEDPWGRRDIYISPGSQGAYDLYTFGPDGRDGGGDDIFPGVKS